MLIDKHQIAEDNNEHMSTTSSAPTTRSQIETDRRQAFSKGNNSVVETTATQSNQSKPLVTITSTTDGQQHRSFKSAQSIQSLPSTPSKAKKTGDSQPSKFCCSRIFSKAKVVLCCKKKSNNSDKGRNNVKVYKTIRKSDIVHHDQIDAHLGGQQLPAYGGATLVVSPKEKSVSILNETNSLSEKTQTVLNKNKSGTGAYTYSDLVSHPETLRIEYPTVNTKGSLVNIGRFQNFTQADVCSLPTLIVDEKMMAQYLENNTSTTTRLPSYTGLSRVISGYADYNNYCPELKRDPPKPSSNNLRTNHLKTRQVEDRVDNFYSLPPDINEKILLSTSDNEKSSKSLIQKKIQSLYGESFAEDWQKSRSKVRSTSSMRSPSCPPNRSNSQEGSNKVSALIKTQKVSFDDSSRSIPTKTPEVARQRQNSESANTFIEKLSEAKTQIRQKITEWDSVLPEFSESMPEEAIGFARATIGKANLLLDKKFRQFEELCLNSLNQTGDEEFKIKFDDLRGFWEMMLIQVNEVDKSFDRLQTAKANNWQGLEEAEQNNKKLPPRLDAKNGDNSFSPSRKSSKDETSSPSPGDLERRARLLEIKKQGKLKQVQAVESNKNNEITIFMSTVTNLESNTTNTISTITDDNNNDNE